jgi:uncharacterized protein YPO0396
MMYKPGSAAEAVAELEARIEDLEAAYDRVVCDLADAHAEIRDADREILRMREGRAE